MTKPEASAPPEPESRAAAEAALAHTAAARSVRWRVGAGAAVILVLLGIAVAVVAGLTSAAHGGTSDIASVGAGSSPGPAITGAPTGVTTTAPAQLVVHVLGQVRHPGVYELPAGSRAIDAVEAAGGFTAAADQGGLNLAGLLQDGQQVDVPKPGQIVAPATTEGSGGAATGAGTTAAPAAPIDLNTATEEQLETLPRVGPAMAQRILSWRAANGGFRSVADLQNVTGIGDKTFAQLKALVTVG